MAFLIVPIIVGLFHHPWALSSCGTTPPPSRCPPSENTSHVHHRVCEGWDPHQTWSEFPAQNNGMKREMGKLVRGTQLLLVGSEGEELQTGLVKWVFGPHDNGWHPMKKMQLAASRK